MIKAFSITGLLVLAACGLARPAGYWPADAAPAPAASTQTAGAVQQKQRNNKIEQKIESLRGQVRDLRRSLEGPMSGGD